jgi:hypothetical protein
VEALSLLEESRVTNDFRVDGNPLQAAGQVSSHFILHARASKEDKNSICMSSTLAVIFMGSTGIKLYQSTAREEWKKVFL